MVLGFLGDIVKAVVPFSAPIVDAVSGSGAKAESSRGASNDKAMPTEFKEFLAFIKKSVENKTLSDKEMDLLKTVAEAFKPVTAKSQSA